MSSSNTHHTVGEPGHHTPNTTATGETGQYAAQSTKSAFKEAGNLTEGLRKNVNAFADELFTHHGSKTHGGDGIHPDAKRTGDKLAEGAGAAVGKVEHAVDRNKTTTTTTEERRV